MVFLEQATRWLCDTSFSFYLKIYKGSITGDDDGWRDGCSKVFSSQFSVKCFVKVAPNLSNRGIGCKFGFQMLFFSFQISCVYFVHDMIQSKCFWNSVLITFSRYLRGFIFLQEKTFDVIERWSFIYAIYSFSFHTTAKGNRPFIGQQPKNKSEFTTRWFISHWQTLGILQAVFSELTTAKRNWGAPACLMQNHEFSYFLCFDVVCIRRKNYHHIKVLQQVEQNALRWWIFC